MTRLSRRDLLRAGAGAAAVALAGCSSASPAGTSGDTSTPAGTATGTPAGTIDTLAVAGSPGERLPVQPAGRVALLDFFATWCAPCKPQMAELRAIGERFPAVHLLSITWENDRDLVASFWREYDGTWPVAMDPEIRTGERYGIRNLPTLLVLDPDGEEVWRHVGLSGADTIAAKLRAAGATETA
jgi:thiol-disulfide isomerase/thioredoxin